MDHAPRHWWILNSLKSMFILAIGLNVLLELALRGVEWLFDWTCFGPRFWPRLGYVESEVYAARLPVTPVANSVAPSQGCVEAAWLLPVVFLGIALTVGAAFPTTGRFRMRAFWAIIPLAVGLGTLRVMAIIAFSNSTRPLTHYLRVDFPSAIDTFFFWFDPIGVLIIDLGLLLLGIALGRRIARGRQVTR